MTISRRLIVVVGGVVLLGLLFVAGTSLANHSWGGYHWARTANPLTLKLGDNLSAAWDSYLVTTSNDWSLSTVLDTVIVPGGTTPKKCQAVLGRAEVCNSRYGRNGWLGLASIWVNGSHITKGTVKMNDTYFNMSSYNTPAWKNLVMCQEVGHMFGLDHQDEDFNNAPLETCMDYSNDPNPNQHPNQHDYDMLETIYAHLDTTTTASQLLPTVSANINLDDPKDWGKELRKSRDGHVSLYERNFGQGVKIFTFVFWADGKHP